MVDRDSFIDHEVRAGPSRSYILLIVRGFTWLPLLETGLACSIHLAS